MVDKIIDINNVTSYRLKIVHTILIYRCSGLYVVTVKYKQTLVLTEVGNLPVTYQAYWSVLYLKLYYITTCLQVISYQYNIKRCPYCVPKYLLCYFRYQNYFRYHTLNGL